MSTELAGSDATAVARIPHDPALDGARGVAVLMVLFSHLSKLGIATSSPLNLRGTGRYGVFLFFVLSSFLLTRQIMAAPPVQLRTVRYWANYALRRFLRVYPAFFAALVLFVLFYQQGKNNNVGKFPSTWQDVLDHLMLSKGMAVFWTIPVEFKYYLLLPFIALLFRALMGSVMGATACWVAIVAVMSLLFPPQFGINMLCYVPIFVCGDFASFLVLRMERTTPPPWAHKAVEIAGWLGVAFVVFMAPYIAGHIFWRDAPYHDDVYTKFHLWYVPFGIAFAAIVVAAVAGRGGIRKAMSWTPLVFTGRISYSLYLMHMLVLSFAMAAVHSVALRVAIAVVGSFALATVSYFVIERPLSRVRLKLT